MVRARGKGAVDLHNISGYHTRLSFRDGAATKALFFPSPTTTFERNAKMAHSWRKRFLNRPPVEESPRFNFTAVQILDFTGEGSEVETKRVHVEETARSQLPELSEGTAVRWMLVMK